jgi:hypothetical protein
MIAARSISNRTEFGIIKIRNRQEYFHSPFFRLRSSVRQNKEILATGIITDNYTEISLYFLLDQREPLPPSSEFPTFQYYN